MTDQRLASGRGLSDHSVVEVGDPRIQAADAEISTERTICRPGQWIADRSIAGKIGPKNIPGSSGIADDGRHRERAIEVTDNPEAESTGYIETSTEGNLVSAIEQRWPREFIWI